jgi:predicted transposase YbfD/YdcC
MFLRWFLALPNGIPSHDTFSRVFARLRPQAFQECLLGWLKDFQEGQDGDIIAIDGKTLRRPFDKAAETSPLHSVSAWSTKHHVTLGQVAVAAKSNEITAIPALLQMLDLEGAVVTIDAAGCQKQIAETIVAAGGDYVLALKGNHEHLYQDVQEAFEKHLQRPKAESGPGDCKTTSKGHGRNEERHCHAIPAPKSLRGRTDWVGLATIVMVVGIRLSAGVETADVRYYLSSLPAKARRLAHAIRRHWSIENRLHWVLDVAFQEDQCRVRKDHGPENLAQLNRLAVSLLKHDRHNKVGIACKRKMCGWHDDYLLQILAGKVSS